MTSTLYTNKILVKKRECKKQDPCLIFDAVWYLKHAGIHSRKFLYLNVAEKVN